MKQFENNNRTFLAVEVPDGANRFHVFNDDPNPYIFHWQGNETRRIYLPEGQWKIIGRFNELSEEHAEYMVEMSCRVANTTKLYRCHYPVEESAIVHFAKPSESLHSLLDIFGLVPYNTLLLEKIKE